MDGHKTTESILKSGAFTDRVGDFPHLEACNYVGTVSGRDVPNKVVKVGFHTSKSKFVNAPFIDELPVTVECRLESYDPKTGRRIGEIINVSAQNDVLDENGNIDADRFKALTYDPVQAAYRKLGGFAGYATQVCDINK